MDQEDSDIIKTTHLDNDKKQTDVCTDTSVGDEMQSAGVKQNATMITVKGTYTMLVSE